MEAQQEKVLLGELERILADLADREPRRRVIAFVVGLKTDDRSRFFDHADSLLSHLKRRARTIRRARELQGNVDLFLVPVERG